MKKKPTPIPAQDSVGRAPQRRASRRLGLAPADTVRLAAFFEHDPLPVSEVGADGRILYMNAAARKAFPGLSPATRSHPWIDGIREGVLPQFASQQKRVVRRIVAVGDRWYEQSLHFIRKEGRTLIYGQDITRRKTAEQGAAQRGRQLSAVSEQLRAAYQEQRDSEQKIRAFNQKLSAVSEELQATGKELKAANRELTSAEVELREQVARTREILMSMTDAYFACDGQWRFISVNPVAARTIFQRPAAELLGKGIWNAPPLDRDDVFGRAVREAVASRRYSRFEWHLSQADTWHEAHINPRAGRVDINLRDITERKRAEQALRESDERLRFLGENMPGLLFYQMDVGADGRTRQFTFISGSVEQLHGTTAAAVLADAGQIYSQICEEYRQQLAEREADAIKAMVPFNCEVMVELPSGEMKWRQFISIPRPRPNQRIWDGVEIDITGKKNAEQTLRESEERYRLLYDSINDSVWIHEIGPGGPGKFLEVNARCCQRLGYTREEMLKMKVSQIDAPEQVEKIPEISRRLLAEGQAVFEADHITKDGHRVSLELNVRMIKYQGRDAAMAVMRDITERKQADRALRESEAKYRAHFNQASDGIIFMPVGSPRITVNESFARMHGYGSPAEMEHLRLEDLDTPATAKLAPERLRRMMAGEALDFEVEHYRKDGSTFFLQVSCSVIRIGEQSFFLGFHRDITERKQAESALRDSEARYRLLVKYAPAGIYEFDYRTGTIVTANDVMCEYTGYTRDEILHMNPLDLLEGESKALLRQRLVDAPAGGELPQSVEYKIRCKDGSILWGNFLSSYIFENNRPILATTVVNNITERKQAEAALLDSEQRYRALAETSPDMIFTVDRGGFVRYLNRTAAKYMGREPEATVGKHIRECFPPEVFERQWRTLQSVLASGQPKYLQNQSVFQGRRYWLDTWLVPLPEPEGTVSLVMGISRDITEHKRMEAELQQYQQNLEQLVEQRTNELAQRTIELNATRRLSDIGTLAATVAHELRNPLAAIRMATYNIRHKAQLPALASHLATIDNKVTDCDQIIKNLLFYSRIRSPDYQTFTIDAVLDDVVAAIAERHQNKRISFAWSDDSARGLTVDADPLLVRELFENLLDNAADAVPDSDGRIEINTAADPAGRCLVRIADNGPGIDPALLPKVFDPFFSTKSKGTGLGLAVCRQISNLHGGEITLDTAPGRGTTVTVSLPRQKDDE